MSKKRRLALKEERAINQGAQEVLEGTSYQSGKIHTHTPTCTHAHTHTHTHTHIYIYVYVLQHCPFMSCEDHTLPIESRYY